MNERLYDDKKVASKLILTIDWVIGPEVFHGVSKTATAFHQELEAVVTEVRLLLQTPDGAKAATRP